MFLSSIQLDLSSPSVRQCLRDCQDMHRTIMQAFPDVMDAQSRRSCGVLYRIMHRHAAIRAYVLSGHCPHWEAIADLGFGCEGVKDVSNLPSAFREGRRLSFDALLCPTKKVVRPDGNSRRAFLASAADRAGWLDRKGEQNGFVIEWVREDGQVIQSGVRGKDKSSVMHHVGVRFRGVLVVTDKEVFSGAFARGIGAGKAYGFGLLMLS